MTRSIRARDRSSELKEISRNSIEYSFLPVAEKARTRTRLEAAFTSFEAAYR